MLTTGQPVVDPPVEVGRDMPNREANQRRRQILAEIARLGFCLPGSLVERVGRCGNPGCACQRDDTRRHGPYPLWTRKLAGKSASKNLTAHQRDTYRSWFDNRRRLGELIAELEQLSVAVMAQDEGWDVPPAPPPDQRRTHPRRTAG